MDKGLGVSLGPEIISRFKTFDLFHIYSFLFDYFISLTSLYVTKNHGFEIFLIIFSKHIHIFILVWSDWCWNNSSINNFI